MRPLVPAEPVDGDSLEDRHAGARPQRGSSGRAPCAARADRLDTARSPHGDLQGGAVDVAADRRQHRRAGRLDRLEQPHRCSWTTPEGQIRWVDSVSDGNRTAISTATRGRTGQQQCGGGAGHPAADHQPRQPSSRRSWDMPLHPSTRPSADQPSDRQGAARGGRRPDVLGISDHPPRTGCAAARTTGPSLRSRRDEPAGRRCRPRSPPRAGVAGCHPGDPRCAARARTEAWRSSRHGTTSW